LRTLARGIERGLFTVTGAGTKTEPLRYGVMRETNATERQTSAMKVADGTETPGV
jgi:hypothetical protein